MAKFTKQTRRMLILGIILLASLGALVGKYEVIGFAVVGFLTLLKGDSDED